MFFTWLHLCSLVCLDVANEMTQEWLLKWGVHEPKLVLSASIVVRLATHALNHNFCNNIQLTHF